MTDIEALYRKHAVDVHRFAFWLSGDESMADDITSETFVRAWAGSDGIRTETAKAYLLAIARNLYRQGLRRSSRNVELDAELPDGSPRPDTVAEARQTLGRVVRALGELPEIDRAALLLRVEHQLPYREISSVLGVRETTAKVKVHRARLFLKKHRDGGSTT